jgi:hypothetical protein
LNERFEQYINGKRENLHSNFTLRLKKILWEARSTPTLDMILINYFRSGDQKVLEDANVVLVSHPRAGPTRNCNLTLVWTISNLGS